MEPALVGRYEELGALGTAAGSGPGAVVVGPPGIGKTRLVSEAVKGLQRRTWWMAVTRESGAIPFGPFVPLIPELGEMLATEGGAASVFGVVRKTLHQGERQPLLVVDDAHLLDEASAATIHALAGTEGIPVVGTIRDGETVPEVVTSLWKDLGLDRFQLGPLSRAESDALSELLLEGSADVRSLTKLWRLSQGNPMELRELILSARESGTLLQVDGIWTLTEQPVPSSRLVELVEERLRRLGDEERRGAETLAYGEPLPLELLLEVVEPEVVESLERAAVVRVGRSGETIASASLAHPLYGEVLRAGLPSARHSILAGELAEAVSRVESSGLDPLRVATWRLESGIAAADELAAAARDAVARMAWELALRFGRAALDLEESYMAHTVVGASLAEVGQVEEAERHIRRAQEITDNPMLEAWADISLGDLWFYHAGRMDEALELLRKHLAITSDPEIREDLSAALSVNLMMHGDIAEVGALAGEVLDSEAPSSRARLMALVASTLVAGLGLRPGEAHSGVEAALPLVEENRARFPNAEDLLHAALTMADIGACDVAAVRQRIDQRRRLALESDRADLPGFWGLLHGQLLLYEGQAQASHDALTEALLLLEKFDSWLSRPLALVEAGHAAAVMGQPSQARRHLTGVPELLKGTPRIRSRHDHVAALVTALEKGVTAGAEEAVSAGDQAAADDHLLWAAEAWHLAARMGHPEPAVPRLAGIAADREGTSASLFHAHAAALLEEDTEGLDQALRSFEQAGFVLFAAETACQVAGIHRRRAEGSRARRYAARAHELLPEGSKARTPAFADLPDTPPLTPREREVALLAATGITSREIADRLYLSVRSVDNHLARAYVKLGVKGRAELSEVLAPAE